MMWFMTFVVEGVIYNPAWLRVEAQSKITMMKEKAVKDLGQHNAEMKEAEKVIAHERLLKDFMTTKCSERMGQDEDQEMGRRQCKTWQSCCNLMFLF